MSEKLVNIDEEKDIKKNKNNFLKKPFKFLIITIFLIVFTITLPFNAFVLLMFFGVLFFLFFSSVFFIGLFLFFIPAFLIIMFFSM